ncbi:MAG: DUF5011 domain-containing protein, partial [Candidatus Marinimicrobia bacterium]|nr:DUF5011 domain-containing protein [Candidatus Neomarinimicrobiota bacterium]
AAFDLPEYDRNVMLLVLASMRGYYNGLEAARASMPGGEWPEDALPFPDQILAVLPHGGKADSRSPSNPGGGRVACVGTHNNSGMESLIAHEVCHNLDTNDVRTWGEHVCDPGDATWDDSDCGADGCDLAWPWLDPYTHEIGFDTRLPWEDGWRDGPEQRDRYTVIDGIPRSFISGAGFPLTVGFKEYMSYCNSMVYDEVGDRPLWALPHKWVSAYRWQAIFDRFAPDATAVHGRAAGGMLAAPKTEAPTDVLYVSGRFEADGGGSLEPVVRWPGYETAAGSQGDGVVELVDAGGTVLFATAFQVDFDGGHVDGEMMATSVLDTVEFQFRLPAKAQAAAVVLKRDGVPLAARPRSAKAPTVQVLAPNGGESWAGVQTIRWQAFDEDGDDLSFIIQYSPNGAYWLPVAWGLPQVNQHDVDTAQWPGGTNARVRVIVTDGFNTTSDESDLPFMVPDKPPQIVVVAPRAGAPVPPGAPVDFEVRVFDLEENAVADTHIVWSYGTNQFASGPRPPARLPPGIQTVTVTAFDSQGNSNQVELAVATADGTPPWIELFGPNPMPLEQGTAFSEPGFSATDDVDGDLTANVVTGGVLDARVPGLYAVTYDVQDSAGNRAATRRRYIDVCPLRIKNLRADGFQELTLTWSSFSGSTYAVQSTTNLLNTPSWSIEALREAIGSQTDWTDNGPGTSKFYRILRTLP